MDESEESITSSEVERKLKEIAKDSSKNPSSKTSSNVLCKMGKRAQYSKSIYN